MSRFRVRLEFITSHKPQRCLPDRTCRGIAAPLGSSWFETSGSQHAHRINKRRIKNMHAVNTHSQHKWRIYGYARLIHTVHAKIDTRNLEVLTTKARAFKIPVASNA